MCGRDITANVGQHFSTECRQFGSIAGPPPPELPPVNEPDLEAAPLYTIGRLFRQLGCCSRHRRLAFQREVEDILRHLEDEVLLLQALRGSPLLLCLVLLPHIILAFALCSALSVLLHVLYLACLPLAALVTLLRMALAGCCASDPPTVFFAKAFFFFAQAFWLLLIIPSALVLLALNLDSILLSLAVFAVVRLRTGSPPEQPTLLPTGIPVLMWSWVWMIGMGAEAPSGIL